MAALPPPLRLWAAAAAAAAASLTFGPGVSTAPHDGWPSTRASLRRPRQLEASSSEACEEALSQVYQVCSDELNSDICRLGSVCNITFEYIWANCSSTDFLWSLANEELYPVSQVEHEYRYLCSPCMQAYSLAASVPRCRVAFDTPGGSCDQDCYPLYNYVYNNCTSDMPPVYFNVSEWQSVRAELEEKLAACPSYELLTTFTTTATRTRRCVQISEEKAQRLQAVPCGGSWEDTE